MKKGKILGVSLLITVGIFASVSSTSTPIPEPSKKKRECNCPHVYDPVCANGVIYSNRCFALCAGNDPEDIGNCFEE